MVIDHWSFSRLVVRHKRRNTFCQWPKNIRRQRNSHISSEVSEHMTVIPVVVFLLPAVNCDHFNLHPVATLVSFVGNSAVGSTALESGGMGLTISSENCIWSSCLFCLSESVLERYRGVEQIPYASIDTHQLRSVVKLNRRTWTTPKPAQSVVLAPSLPGLTFLWVGERRGEESPSPSFLSAPGPPSRTDIFGGGREGRRGEGGGGSPSKNKDTAVQGHGPCGRVVSCGGGLWWVGSHLLVFFVLSHLCLFCPGRFFFVGVFLTLSH